MLIRITFFLWVILFGPFTNAFGQSNLGTPIIHSYPKEVFNGGLQNWEIQQGADGRMYFANNQGLLVFDGSSWQIWKVPNNTIVRSILIDGQRIYVGSQGDFGYFEANDQGILQYISLLDKFPAEHRKIADVWRIIKVNGRILFRTHKKLFQYKDEIKLIESSEFFSLLAKVGEKIYVGSTEKGISLLNGENLVSLSFPIVNGTEILDVIPFEDGLLFSLKNKGLFRFKNNVLEPWYLEEDELIRSHRIDCLQELGGNLFAIGSLSGGVFIMNNFGKVIQHIDTKNGLLANEVLDIFKDKFGNIWVALNNGIAYIEINAPFSNIIPDEYMESSGYAVKIHKKKIYLGTSNGLYQAEWKNYYNPLNISPFELVDNSKGQVWNLGVQNDQLLLSHNRGAFVVSNDRAIKVNEVQGSWGFLQLKGFPNYFVEGTYFGLNLYKYKNEKLELLGRIKNIPEESCRILATDNSDNVWVSHPYRGVFKIQIDVENIAAKSIKLYNQDTGFPSNWVNVFDVGNGVVFTTEKGIYIYDEKQDEFSLSEEWNQIFPKENTVKRLIPDGSGNIWFVENHQVGVVRVEDVGINKKLHKEYFPKLNDKLVGGFENIYIYNDENVFFPVERGFVHFNPKNNISSDSMFQVHIQEVVSEDSLVFGGWNYENQALPEFSCKENDFVFKYAATEYSDVDQVEFKYKLEGLDEDWSKWKKTKIKEYTELPCGDYKFLIKAKNAFNSETEIKSFAFRILTPWYFSNLAKFLFALFVLLFLLGLIFIPRKQFEYKTAKLKQEQEQTISTKTKEYEEIVEKSKAEISELQAEKMKNEIQFKNQELATTTMHLVQKGVLLAKLKENLSGILRNPLADSIKKDIKGTINLLDNNLQFDEDWNQFAKYFDEVHVDFLKRLKEAYPELTSKDQRMCTYLKMNLTTKEIVPLLNISVRGVEVSRYRLRKKLGLDKTVNLNDFLMNF